MTHVIAILALGATCALWYVVQRAVDKPDTPLCGEMDRGCHDCERRDTAGCVTPIRALPRADPRRG
jgi:hypothetical protein